MTQSLLLQVERQIEDSSNQAVINAVSDYEHSFVSDFLIPAAHTQAIKQISASISQSQSGSNAGSVDLFQSTISRDGNPTNRFTSFSGVQTIYQDPAAMASDYLLLAICPPLQPVLPLSNSDMSRVPRSHQSNGIMES